MDDSVLLPVAFRITKDLGPFLLATTEDTLSLVLETLSSVLDIGKGTWITSELAEQIVAATLQVWINNNKGTYHNVNFLTLLVTKKQYRSDFDIYPYGNIYIIIRIASRDLPSPRKGCDSDSV